MVLSLPRSPTPAEEAAYHYWVDLLGNATCAHCGAYIPLDAPVLSVHDVYCSELCWMVEENVHTWREGIESGHDAGNDRPKTYEGGVSTGIPENVLKL